MRLFSALWLPEAAGAHAADALRRIDLPAGVRPVPAEKWHLTLAFYGDDASLPERVAQLDDRLAGLPAPALRLAGAGAFAGVLWIGVRPVAGADRDALEVLAAAAGARRPYRPHVTIARWRPGTQGRPGTRWRPGELAERFAGYRGPRWVPASVSLVRSEPGAGYTTVHGVPLITW